jgi:glycosyltransferase involved in cell wall biosynthesis
MKIVVNALFSKHKTGIGRVVENYLQQLSKIDTNNKYFIFVSKEFNDLFRFDNPNFKVLSTGLEGASSFRTSLLNHLWLQTVFPAYTARIHADLVILFQISLYLIKMAPTIYFQHDLIEHHIPNQKPYQLLFRKIALPLNLRMADKIIGVSQNTLKDIRTVWPVKDEKVRVIYNGVDRSLFREVDRKEAKKILREKHGISNNFLLYTGTLTLPQKNLLRLVDAYHTLRGRGITDKLILVGSSGKDSNLILERIKKLKLEEHVVCPGYVPDADLPYFYNAAHIFCFPSIYEGFALPILEAMACGCPVVTSSTSSMPEVAGDAALLVDPYNTEEITEALHRLLIDHELQAEKIKKGFRQVQKFSWEKSSYELLGLIKSFES